MRPKRALASNPHQQRGIGLVAAIFLIMVSALLSLAIARSVRTSSGAFSVEILSERALLAAESGAELSLNRLFAPSGASNCTAQNYPLTDLGLPACNASVRCDAVTVDGGDFFTITSDGRCDAGDLIAHRQVIVRAQP